MRGSEKRQGRALSSSRSDDQHDLRAALQILEQLRDLLLAPRPDDISDAQEILLRGGSFGHCGEVDWTGMTFDDGVNVTANADFGPDHDLDWIVTGKIQAFRF